MDNPKYVLSVISPFGVSEGFQEYLSRILFSSTGTALRNRDLIANKLLELYKNSHLPFCCTYLGWISPRYPAVILEQALRLIIDNIVDETNGELLFSESFSKETSQSSLQIVGAYPLFELEDEFRVDEYKEVSFLENKDFINDLLNWSTEAVVEQAIGEIEFGIMFAILGEENDLILKKQQEIDNLLREAFGMGQTG